MAATLARDSPGGSGRIIHLDPNLPHKAPTYLIQSTAWELLEERS